jgi:hypothetical protein
MGETEGLDALKVSQYSIGQSVERDDAQKLSTGRSFPQRKKVLIQVSRFVGGKAKKTQCLAAFIVSFGGRNVRSWGFYVS